MFQYKNGSHEETKVFLRLSLLLNFAQSIGVIVLVWLLLRAADLIDALVVCQ